MVTATNEAAAQTLFEGHAHLNNIDRDAITYDLYGPNYSNIAASSFERSIVDIFSYYCGILGLTLNSTYARSPSPTCKYEDLIGQNVIDGLSGLAAFFTHRFYIIGATLYLVDSLADNGSTVDLTEFDIFPSKYT